MIYFMRFWKFALELELMGMIALLRILPKLSKVKAVENRLYSLCDGINAIKDFEHGQEQLQGQNEKHR